VHIVQRVYSIVNTKTSGPIAFVGTINRRAAISLSRNQLPQSRNHADAHRAANYTRTHAEPSAILIVS
jgi:hypothetical protein